MSLGIPTGGDPGTIYIYNPAFESMSAVGGAVLEVGHYGQRCDWLSRVSKAVDTRRWLLAVSASPPVIDIFCGNTWKTWTIKPELS